MQRVGAWVTAGLLLAGCGGGVKNKFEPPNNTTLQVNAVVPATGPVNGGTQAEVQGKGFDDGTGTVSVLFDGFPAQVLNVTDTAVTIVVPPGEGVGSVSVTIENLIGNKTLSDGYAYSEPVFGAAALLWAYDFINPNQFDPAQNDYVDAYAAFFEPVEYSLVDDPPTENTCVLNPTSAGNTFNLLDAGDSALLDSQGLSVNMPRQDTGGGAEYYPTNIIPGTSVYAPDATYTLSAPGSGELEGFDPVEALITPGDFSVDSPAIGSVPAPSVSRNVDLGFIWSGGTPGNVFFIQLDGYANGSYTGKTLLCRPSDVGGFTIPGGQLGQLNQADQAVVYVGRRIDAFFVLPSNSSLGHTAGVIYKVGVVNFQ